MTWNACCSEHPIGDAGLYDNYFTGQPPYYSGTSGSTKTILSRGKSGTQIIVTQLGTSNDMWYFGTWG